MNLHIVDATLTRSPRPVWVLWFIALPVAVLLNSIVLEQFSEARLMLSHHALTWVGDPFDPSAVQRVVAKIMVEAAMPWLAGAALFKLLRLDVWLAPNQVSMVLLGVFNGLYVGQWVYRLYMAGTGGIPYVRGLPGDVFPYLLLSSILGGLVVLMLSTAWHRGAVERWMGIDRFRRLWVEI
jgi:hypothetical protein